MNWNGYYEGNALQQVIIGANDNGAGRMVPGGNAWKFMNMSGSINPACRSAIDPSGTNSSEHWRCLLAENAARYITSRIFPLEQLWGVFGSFCLVNSVCETITICFLDLAGACARSASKERPTFQSALCAFSICACLLSNLESINVCSRQR